MDTSPSTICSEVLAQHERLRQRLRELEAVARRLLCGEPVARAALRRLVLGTTRSLLEHLAFEERAFFPLFARTEPCGRDRARRMVAEHARQRAELAALEDEVTDDAADPIALATEIRTLVAELLVDMKSEEAELIDMQEVPLFARRRAAACA